MHENVGQFQPPTDIAEHGIVADPHVGEVHVGMIGGHVERPPVGADLDAGGFGGHEEAGDAVGIAGLAAGAGKNHVVGGPVHAGVEALGAADHPLIAVAHRRGVEKGGVAAVLRLGQPEGHQVGAVKCAVDELGPLGVGALGQHHEDEREVADDRSLVLQVVVQAQASGGQVLADDGHIQVGSAPAADRLWKAVTQVSCRIGPAHHLPEQRLPLRSGQPAVVPVGAGVLAPVVEVLDVLGLQRGDLCLDEAVKFAQVVGEFGGQIEVHQVPSGPVSVSMRFSRSYSSSGTRRPLAASTIESVRPAVKAAA